MQRRLNRIKVFLNDKDKKPFITMVKESLQLWWLKKEFPIHYFGRFFYRKGAPDGKSFMSLDEYNLLSDAISRRSLNDPGKRAILQDKLVFDQFCIANKLPAPRVVSYNYENVFTYNNFSKALYSSNDVLAFFKSVFKNEKIESLFLKPHDGQCGYGTYLLELDKLNDQYEEVWNLLKDSDYIHQEQITQHKNLNQIYSKSINTLRIETYLDKTNEVHFLGTYMRFGRAGSIIDNVNQGGFIVDIDFEKGELCEVGTTNMNNRGISLSRHPDSNFPFLGFKIPFFDDAVALSKRATLILSGFTVAWDIAITPDGPVFVEGNNHPSFFNGEYSYGGYKNKPVFNEIFERLEQDNLL